MCVFVFIMFVFMDIGNLFKNNRRISKVQLTILIVYKKPKNLSLYKKNQQHIKKSVFLKKHDIKKQMDL